MTTRAEPRIGGQKPSDKRVKVMPFTRGSQKGPQATFCKLNQRAAVARALSALFSFN
jgi:hypothetical protein